MQNDLINYKYIYDNGMQKTRDEVVKDIIEFMGDKVYSMGDIAKGIGLNYVSTTSAVRWAKRNKLIHGKRVGRKYEFGSGFREESSCLLADLLYPKDKILKNFKIKSIKTRKAEDAPNITYIAKGGGVRYTNHVLDTVYD